ncbi:MAG: hypothetical protein IKB34_00660, partial [Clostridia bacterium]|nr:hypothetical protein [Clostridia bacterium]
REHIEQYLLEDAFVADDTIDAVATVSEDGSRVTLTAANRSLYSSAVIKVSDEIAGMRITMSDIVTAEDVRSFNSFDHPDLIHSESFETGLPSITLPPHSVVRLVFNA